MVNIVNDLVERATLESLITHFGGEGLIQSLQKARDLRKHFELTISPEQRHLYLDLEDARTDGAGLREDALVTAAVGIGVGIGAALTLKPSLRAESAMQFGAAVSAALLVLDEAVFADWHELTRGVADAVSRAMEVLERRSPSLAETRAPVGER